MVCEIPCDVFVTKSIIPVVGFIAALFHYEILIYINLPYNSFT